jgi:hypothetical protein
VYQTLEFNNEYNGATDDYDENQLFYIINNHFTLEEMKNILEWVDHPPNYKFSTIKYRFRKYVEKNAKRSEKLDEIKRFLWDEFYVRWTIEKEAVHDANIKTFSNWKSKQAKLR